MSDVAVVALTLVAGWVLSGFSPRLGLAVAGLVASAVYFAMTDERLQRIQTLDDAEYVVSRLQGGANEEFLSAHPRVGSSSLLRFPRFRADHGVATEFAKGQFK